MMGRLLRGRKQFFPCSEGLHCRHRINTENLEVYFISDVGRLLYDCIELNYKLCIEVGDRLLNSERRDPFAVSPFSCFFFIFSFWHPLGCFSLYTF